MPVAELTDEGEQQRTPRSVLRHRPIGHNGTGSRMGRGAIVTIAPLVQRASRPRPAIADVQTDEQDETLVERKSQPPAKPALPAKHKRQAHPFVYLGLGMLVALLLWTVGMIAFDWFTTLGNDLRYGRPRTFQTDAWVGHSEQTGAPSHFIAINLNRRIEVIEISGGDAAHTHIYTGPQLYGAGDDLTPVTLLFVDVNGDKLPDMIVTFAGWRVVFINDGAGFRPLLPSEQGPVERSLQHLQP